MVPIHDEEETLREFYQRLASLLDTLDGPSEVVLVDDGSRDMSLPIMLDINQLDARFKVASLSRNFGHQIAITAGLDLARGDAVAGRPQRLANASMLSGKQAPRRCRGGLCPPCASNCSAAGRLGA